jgi:hypothetical protein
MNPILHTNTPLDEFGTFGPYDGSNGGFDYENDDYTELQREFGGLFNSLLTHFTI